MRQNKKLHVSKSNILSKDSPFKKLTKIESIQYDQSTQRCVTIPREESNCCDEPDIIKEIDEHGEIFEELIGVIVVRRIRQIESLYQLDEYLAFNRLLNNKKFPLTNIAFLLFIDVVRWLKELQS